MVNVILLWSSTYEIVKIIKLFKKLPRKILGDCFIVIIFFTFIIIIIAEYGHIIFHSVFA